MYQIFVVEDELLIRQSIRHIVENMTGPYAFCGEASDGEMALSMMQDLMPDILLTDIRMPFLDGFELIRHVKSMMPWVKIVIISGYGDFEYAQKAIAVGANQYLLKPLRAPELVRTIEALAQRIEQEKSENNMPSGYDQEELNTVLHQHFMHQLLRDHADTSVLLERARHLGLDVIKPCYQPVVFSFDSNRQNARAIQTVMTRVMNEQRIQLYDLIEMDQCAMIVCANEEEALNGETYRLVNILRHELSPYSPTITTVVGGVVNRLSAVADSYQKARELLRNVVNLAPGQVIEADDTAQLTADVLTFNGPFDAEFQRRLFAAQAEEIPALLHDYLNSDANNQFGSVLMRYYALVDVLRMTMQMKQRANPDADPQQLLTEASSEHDLFQAASTRDSFEQLARRLLCDAVAFSQRMLSPKYPPVITRADAYVAEHFCDPNISLMRVAKQVGMSSAHFSTVFSQAHGIPFISYLTGMRIERAKKLLVETDMKLSAIAMEIGYNEPNYFSHVFRKAEGMTPKEYRMNAGRGE